MSQIRYVLGAGLLAFACSSGPPSNGESTSSSTQELDVAAVRNLTRMQGTQTSHDEQVREDDTANLDTAYYRTQGISTRSVETGLIGNSVFDAYPTLNQFQRWYGLSTTAVPASGEATAIYYNRADLGIGREMHCIDKYDSVRAIACYVKNFAAGDDGSEFTFGQSPDIAFANANNQHAFATVAMVFQPVSLPRVLFLVYDGTGSKLLPAAALDRVGIAYQNVFNQPPSAARTAKLATLGVPGVNFNNHIPSNCITCHGGNPYSRATGAFDNGNQFLPFDLDNFDFDSTHTRIGQEDSFRALNQIVRRVAELNTKIDGTPADVKHSIRNQIDGWYNNPAQKFNSDYVPPGWDSNAGAGATPGATALYKNVIRGNCRNCHIANNYRPGLAFDDEGTFLFVAGGLGSAGLTAGANSVVSDLTTYQMPHALQSTRQFWLSSAPAALETYYRRIAQTVAAANILHSANGANVVTLDPDVVSAMQLE